MNKKYEVTWSNTAEKDLVDIIEYIAADSSSNAFAVFKNIKQKASSLYTFPERGRIVPELRDQGIVQYRELLISPWRLIYRIADKNVYGLAVLDSRQNIEDILLKRLITGEYLEERAKRGSRKKFEKVMAKVADVEPEEYDKL